MSFHIRKALENCANIKAIVLTLMLVVPTYCGCVTGKHTEQTTSVNRLAEASSTVAISPKDGPRSNGQAAESEEAERVVKLVSHTEEQVSSSEKKAAIDKSSDRISGSAKSEPGTVWTFDQVVRATLQNDPQLHAGMAAIQESHADWWTSSLPPNPELSISGGTLPFKKVTPDTPGGPPQLDLEVSFPIDWFLFAKRAAAMESARIGIAMSQAEYADQIRQRVTAAAIAYYDVLEAKGLLTLAEEDTRVLTQLQGVMKQAREAGGIPEIDYKRVQLDCLQSQQTLHDAHARLIITKSALWALCGQESDEGDFDISGSLETVTRIEPLPFDEALEMARQNRPDLRHKQLQVHQASANQVVEHRNAFPEISPAFGYSHQYQECIGDPDYDGWGIGLGMSVPIFDRNQGNRSRAAASLLRAQYDLRGGMIDLRAEIRQAEQDLRTSLAKTESIASSQVQLATQVRDSVIEAYKAGGYHLIDVLNAENSYRETKRLYLTSRADYWRALFTYHSVTGKTSMQGGNIHD